MLRSRLLVRHRTCNVARLHTTTHAACFCTSHSLFVGTQSCSITLWYPSAIAPFCAPLMQHQVHSGIPPSLPTPFEGRHFCSTRASIYSTSFARISYTNGNSCLNANIQLQSLTPSQMPPRLECVFADACQLGRRLLTLLAIQLAELRRPKRFAPRNVFCFLCNQTPDA